MIYHRLFFFLFQINPYRRGGGGNGGVGKTLSMISSGLGEKAMTASKEQQVEIDLISSRSKPVSCAGAKTARVESEVGRESPDKEKQNLPDKISRYVCT